MNEAHLDSGKHGNSEFSHRNIPPRVWRLSAPAVVHLATPRRPFSLACLQISVQLNFTRISEMETLAPPPKLTHLFTLRCVVDPPMEIGNGPYGRRRCVPIMSGSVRGPYFNGEVVPGGADFMYIQWPQSRRSYV